MSPMEHRQRQVGILRAPDKSGSVMQVMWVMMENLATKLASRQKLQGLESTCYHCWVTVDSAFASFDNFWEPVFNDPRWKLTRFKARSMLGDGESIFMSIIFHAALCSLNISLLAYSFYNDSSNGSHPCRMSPCMSFRYHKINFRIRRAGGTEALESTKGEFSDKAYESTYKSNKQV